MVTNVNDEFVCSVNVSLIHTEIQISQYNQNTGLEISFIRFFKKVLFWAFQPIFIHMGYNFCTLHSIGRNDVELDLCKV